MSEEPQMLPAWDLREYPLSFECTNDLSLHLDPENPLADDWRMLAVNLGYNESIVISSLERHKSPTKSVLRMYVTQCEWPTWQGLQYALRNIKRADAEHKLVQHAGKLGLSSEAAKEGLPIGWDKPANLKRSMKVQPFSHSCIDELSKLLLLDHPLSKDWKLLASILKYSNSDIEQFGSNRNPASALLQDFQCKHGATLGDFYNALVEMPRYDVIYALWKLNELTTEVESNTVNPNQPTVQSLPPGANRPTVRQTARQMSEQNPRTQPSVGKSRNPPRQRTSIESVIDKLKQLGFDESTARTAVLEASRETGIEDTEDLLDEALEIITELSEEYDGAGRDFQMPPMQSMPSVMNITGGNVQIGSHNKIIYTEKPSQRTPKTKARGNTKQRDRGTSRQESKQVPQANPSAARRKSDALRILGIPEEDIKRLIETNPELNENELANLYFQGIESLQKRPIPSEDAHPDVPQYVDQREIPDQNIHGSIPETHPIEQTRLQNQDAERQRCLEIDRGAKPKTRENPADQNIQPTPQGPSQSQKAHSPGDINEEIAKKISRQPVAAHLQARGNLDGGGTSDATRSNIAPRENQAKQDDGDESKPQTGSTAQKVPNSTSTTGAVPKVKFEDNAPGDGDGRKTTTASGPTAKMPSVVVPDSSLAQNQRVETLTVQKQAQKLKAFNQSLIEDEMTQQWLSRNQ
ncbi:uncharacterized protein [Ptychodera flava]|uniref:uncharacterized protein isoform X1 n=1 Tax=Ptychodera flava TaxID=63121 RepID=UPI00396A4C4A